MSQNSQITKAVSTKIYMTQSQKLQYYRVTISNVWRLHRLGRISASNYYDVIPGKSKTLLSKFINYVALTPNLSSLVYGREMKK